MIEVRRERIVYTRRDGCVSVVHPSANCMRWMTLGGRWGDKERGYLNTQIERQVAAGHDERAVVRFCLAMAFGGCTDAEALEIIRDRDCAHLGTGIELWDITDLPEDRWFRDAWRRSQNGGPIKIDMSHARRIQLHKIQHSFYANKFKLKLGLWRARIRKAKTPEELREVWPGTQLK